MGQAHVSACTAKVSTCGRCLNSDAILACGDAVGVGGKVVGVMAAESVARNLSQGAAPRSSAAAELVHQNIVHLEEFQTIYKYERGAFFQPE